jgi:hypothetical protein
MIATCTLKLFTKVIYNAHAVLLTNALITTIHLHLCLIFTGKARSLLLVKVEYDNVMSLFSSSLALLQNKLHGGTWQGIS